jgi:hypothetical protein
MQYQNGVVTLMLSVGYISSTKTILPSTMNRITLSGLAVGAENVRNDHNDVQYDTLRASLN